MCTELASGSSFDMFPYNPNPYTEAQWMPSTMASVPGFEYGGATYASSHGQQHPQQQQHQQQQHQPHHGQQQQQTHQHHPHPSPHQQPPVRQGSHHRQQGQSSKQSQHVDISAVPPHLLDADRQKSSPGGYDGAANESSHYQDQHSQQQPQSAHSDASRYTAGMNAYSYQPTTLPLSPPTSTAAYMSHDMGPGMGGNNAGLTRASPVPIAPNPADTRKRKRTTPTPERPPELNEEEKLLLKLKEDENLPWKDIAVRFQQDIGKVYQVPALQMRFKRLRERIRQWTENDIQALEQAHEYWEKHQFEIIATKMLDFGCPERFPAKAVQRKWEELHHDRLASQRQPFPFAGTNSTTAFPIGTYPGSHGILPSQHHGGFIRHLPAGPGAAAVAPSGIGSYPGTGNLAGSGRFVFGQHPITQPIHIPTAHGGLAGTGSGPSYGTSPLVSSSNKLPSAIGAPSNGSAGDTINNARPASIPTPRSTGGSPGPFTAADDAALAAAAAAAAAAGGTTSITEVGGINMGLGLALSMSPSMATEPIRGVNSGNRQRSFSDMH